MKMTGLWLVLQLNYSTALKERLQTTQVFFRWELPANKPVALVFTYTGYATVQKNFDLHEGERKAITVKMSPLENKLPEVTVKDETQRQQSGTDQY
jgi:hypothetical protein